uniref:G_PROTEIN_RECEP_F1_2 domain-containing protein n=1 Tax=Strongyloides papillosus TaxID=174720 RepID=A0A0N5BK96_STREA
MDILKPTEFDLIPIKIPIAQNVVNFFTIFFIILFIRHLILSTHYHVNIKILFSFMVFYDSLMMVVELLIFCGLLEGYFKHETYFGSVIPCKVFLCLEKFSAMGSISIFYIITAERIIASVRYKTYEKEKHKLIYILVCIYQIIIISLVVYFSLLEDERNQGRNSFLIPCLRSYFNHTFMRFPVIVLLIGAIINAVLFCFLIYYNNNLYKKSNTKFCKNILSNKFQLSENLQFSKALLPCIITYLFAGVILGVLYFHLYAMRTNIVVSTQEQIIYELEVNQLSDFVFAVAYLIIYFITNIKLIRLKRFMSIKNNKVLPVARKRSYSISTNMKKYNKSVNDIYFEQFNKQLEAKRISKKK